jgi:hypothetical protein
MSLISHTLLRFHTIPRSSGSTAPQGSRLKAQGSRLKAQDSRLKHFTDSLMSDLFPSFGHQCCYQSTEELNSEISRRLGYCAVFQTPKPRHLPSIHVEMWALINFHLIHRTTNHEQSATKYSIPKDQQSSATQLTLNIVWSTEYITVPRMAETFRGSST